jgi:hypothetical protein
LLAESVHLTPNGDHVFLFNDRGQLILGKLSGGPDGCQMKSGQGVPETDRILSFGESFTGEPFGRFDGLAFRFLCQKRNAYQFRPLFRLLLGCSRETLDINRQFALPLFACKSRHRLLQ